MEFRGPSNPKPTPLSIPGYYFDVDTNRYYSLSNCPPEFRAKIEEAKQNEENAKMLKHFKETTMEEKKVMAKAEPVATFPAMFTRREYGLGGRRPWSEKMLPLFTSRLNLRDEDAIRINTIPYTPDGTTWIKRIGSEGPNSFLIGLYGMHEYNHQVIRLTPKKVIQDLSNGDRGHYWLLEKEEMLIDCPDIVHRVTHAQPDIIGPRPPLPMEFPGQSTDESTTTSFLGLHVIGISKSDPAKLTYCLNMIPQERNITQVVSRFTLNLFDLPIPNWPWTEMGGGIEGANVIVPFFRQFRRQFVVPYFETHLHRIASGYGVLLNGHKPRHRNLTQHMWRLETFDLQYSPDRQTPPSSVIFGYSNGNVRMSTFRASPYDVFGAEHHVSDYTIRSVLFNPKKPEQFFVSGDENFLRLYDRRYWVKDGWARHVVRYNEHRSRTLKHQISYDPTTDQLVASGSDHMVRFWNASTGKMVHVFRPFSEKTRAPIPVQAYYCGNFCADEEGPQTEALLCVDGTQVKMYLAGRQFKDTVPDSAIF